MYIQGVGHRSILFHLVQVTLIVVAAVQYLNLAVTSDSTIVSQLTFDYYIVIGLLVASSILLALTRKPNIAVVLIILQFIWVTLIGIPMGNNLTIELALFTLIIFEIQMYLKGPVNIIMNGLVIIGSALFQRPFYAWNTDVPPPASADFYGFVLSLFMLSSLGIAMRSLISQNRRLAEWNINLEHTVERLIKANRDFQDYAISAKVKAESEERKRISREIHDVVGYTLTNLIVMMESATDFSKTDPRQTERLLEQAREVAEHGLEDIRYSLRLLRFVGGERPQGIREIQRMADTFSRTTGINVAIEYGNIPWSFNEEIDHAIYHIVQEGLINAFRHGHATRIKILFWLAENELKILISDNGLGAKSVKEGIGFQGIQERLNRIGGTFRAANTEEGFELSAVIPMDARMDSLEQVSR